MTETPRHFPLLARIALLVALGDYATKELASRLVGDDATVFSDWLHFAVVHNPVAAFSVSLGTYTWQLNLAFTLAAIALMLPVSRDLARVDPLAPRALGLVVGGALGNFVSLVLSPHGVVDFIALNFPNGIGLVLNVADVAAYTGLAMILRTGFLIVAEMRRTAGQVVRSLPGFDAVPALSSRFADREVRRPVHRDDGWREVAVVNPPMGVDREVPLPGEAHDRPVRILPFPSQEERSASERLLTIPPRERDQSRGHR